MYKFTLMAVLMFTCGTALAGPPTYAGVNQNGFVNINSTITSMEGLLNVRSNPQIGHEKSYVYTHHYVNNVVWFQGRDSATGRYFACYYSPADAQYNQAVDIQNNTQEGARLLIRKATSSSKCTSLGLSNGSKYIQ